MYVCFAYARPKDTSGRHGTDCLENIERNIAMFSRVGTCIVIRDLNAHTKTECDYIVNEVLNDCERESFSLPVGYTAGQSSY